MQNGSIRILVVVDDGPLEDTMDVVEEDVEEVLEVGVEVVKAVEEVEVGKAVEEGVVKGGLVVFLKIFGINNAGRSSNESKFEEYVNVVAFVGLVLVSHGQAPPNGFCRLLVSGSAVVAG